MGERSLKAVPAGGRESGGLENSTVKKTRYWTSLVTPMPREEFLIVRSFQEVIP